MKLRADKPQTLCLTPVTSQHLERITSNDLAALVRSCSVFGRDSLLRDALKEAQRRDAAGAHSLLRDALKEAQRRDAAGAAATAKSSSRLIEDNNSAPDDILGINSTSDHTSTVNTSSGRSRTVSVSSVLHTVLNEREIGRGACALHLAVEAAQPACVSLLLRAGANSEVRALLCRMHSCTGSAALSALSVH
jgi:hypothetical protein